MSINSLPLALLRKRLNEIKASCANLIGSALDPYRPELHYMRGPGPKWHAKQQARR